MQLDTDRYIIYMEEATFLFLAGEYTSKAQEAMFRVPSGHRSLFGYVPPPKSIEQENNTKRYQSTASSDHKWLWR